jgi:hypothetical protein
MIVSIYIVHSNKEITMGWTTTHHTTKQELIDYLLHLEENDTLLLNEKELI